jgi:fibronectin-binding autotransporter adhesin
MKHSSVPFGEGLVVPSLAVKARSMRDVNACFQKASERLRFAVQARAAALALGASALLCGHSAQATTETWNSGTGPWDTTTADWTSSVWTQGNDANFNNGGTLTIGATTILANSLNYNTASVSTTISGGILQLGAGGIVGANAATLTIAASTALQLSASQIWNQSGSNLTVNSNVTEAGTGGYTLTLTAGAAHSMTVNGTVNIGAINSNSSNITSTFTNNVTLANAFTNTAGTVTLGGTNSFGGGLTLTGGTTNVSADANLGTTTGAVALNGGTLQINGTTLTSFGSHAVTIGAGTTANLTVAAAANTFNFNTNIAATIGGIAKTGLGNLTVSGNNAYSGATTITDGAVTLDYSTNTGTKIGNTGNTGNLTLNGATLGVLGAQAAPETLKGLVVGGGVLGTPVAPSFANGNYALTFGANGLTHTGGGVIAFATSGGPTIKFTSAAPGAILGAGFATIGDNYVSVEANNVVTAFTAYNNDTFATGNNVNVTTTGDTWGSGVTINTLRVGAAGATTTALTGADILTSGGLLVSSSVGNNLTLFNGVGTLTTASNADFVATLNNSGTTEIDNALTAGGRLVLTGTGGGTLKLVGADTISGTVNLYNGTLEIGNGTGTTTNFNGAVTGVGNLVKSGLGTLVMSNGFNTYTGTTVIKNGILTLNNNTATFGSGTALVTLGDSTTSNNTVLDFSQIGRTFTNPFAVTGTGGTNTIQSQGDGQNFTFNGGFTLGGTNTNLTLSTYGSDSINVSTVGISGTGNLVTNSATTSAVTGSSTDTNFGNVSISSLVNNAGTVTNNGTRSGTVTLSGGVGTNVTSVTENSTTSPLNLTGALTTNATGTSLTNTAGTQFLTLSGGVANTAGNLIIQNNSTTANGVTLSTTAVNNIGTITNSGTGTGSTLISAVIGVGVTGITENGTSPLILSGANLYTSTTTVTSGTLQVLTNPGALGTGAATLSLGGGVLDLASASGTNLNFLRNTTVTGNAQITSDLLSGTVGNTYTLGTLSIGGQTLAVTGGATPSETGSAGLVFGATTLTGNSTFAVTNPTGGGATVFTLGSLNDGGTARTITKSGNGTLTLGTAATSVVTGTQVNITGGTLNSNNATALGSLASVDVSAGTTFGVGATQTIGALSEADAGPTGSVAIGSGTLTVGSTNSNSTFSGVVSGAGALTKAGTGTQILSGNDTYTGATTVTGGTLILAGSNAVATGATSVASGATLQLLTNAMAIAGSGVTLNSSSLTAVGGPILQLRADADTTFNTGTATANSVNGNVAVVGSVQGAVLTVDVNQATSAGSNNVLTIGNVVVDNTVGGVSGNTVFNVTGGNGDSLQVGGILSSNRGPNGQAAFFTLDANTANLIDSGGITGSTQNASVVTFTGAANTTVVGNIAQGGTRGLTLSMNETGSVILNGLNTNGTTFNLNNGTTVVNNNSGLNGTPTLGTTNSTADNVSLLLGGTNATGTVAGTNGGIAVANAIKVEDTDTGLLTVGGQNTSGTNTYSGIITLGATTNTGKSANLVAATGGEVDFTSTIIKNGTDATAGITVNSPYTVNGATVTPTGTVKLTAVNTYAGATTISAGTLTLAGTKTLAATSGITVNSGATLSVTANSALNTPGSTTSTTVGSPVSVSGPVPISLAGGTLLRSGTGVSLGSQSGTAGTVGIGALTLTAASTIDFGTTGVGTLNFNSLSDAGGNTLTITNYTSTYSSNTDPGAGKDNTDDRIIFNQDVSSFLSDITIDGSTPTELGLGNGEFELIAPVPEPATWAAGLLSLGALGFHLRRRRKQAA